MPALVLVAAAIAIQLLTDRHCSFGVIGALEFGASAGIVLYGGAILVAVRGLRLVRADKAERLWLTGTIVLALVALVVNREVWFEMLSARPCGPIEYEDGVRYRAGHAAIGIGYGVIPLLVAAATFARLWRTRSGRHFNF